MIQKDIDIDLDPFPNNIKNENDIFKNSNNNDSTFKEKNDNIDIKNIYEDKYKMKLTLRKKKINEKISSHRKLDDYINNDINRFHFESFILINESFTNLISSIPSESKEENKIKPLLEKISYILEQRIYNIDIQIVGNIYKFTMDDLFENNWMETLYDLTILYLKTPDIINLITRILSLSSLLILNENYSMQKNGNDILYDNNDKMNKQGYFISSDKYIDIYNKLFELYSKKENNDNVKEGVNIDIYNKIIHNMIYFIGNIVDNERDNQDNLYISGTLYYIINSVDIEHDSERDYENKIWCLSKFDLQNKFSINLSLALNIQKIYIEIFLNQNKFNLFEKLNEEMNDNNIFFNFLKLIENTSYCTEVAYFEILLKSNILEFLMDNINVNNTEAIKMVLYIFINLTNADTALVKRLIDIGLIKFLINILTTKNVEQDILGDVMVPLNNLISDSQLWNKVLFDNQVLKVFCILLNDNNLIPGIFGEICLSLTTIYPSCTNHYLKIMVDEYCIIQSLCVAMKKILDTYKNINLYTYSTFLCLMMCYLTGDNIDDELKEDIAVKFGAVNGLEIIDNILNKSIEINTDSNFNNEENIKLIKQIIDTSDIIKDHFRISIYP